ncbi:MAG: tRNA 2-thiocytidine biosynthesis protein TtcA [Oscillospiraceae bacterium]|nr:tRNA 2-thiocytidine biosynthesis protein TtcA [Oscillospiraceae bacterium]
MQKLLGFMRKAITDYNLIEDGDKIAVGVSGGKDSVALLVGLARLRKFIGIDYEIYGITLDPQFSGVPADYSAIEKLCEEYDIKYVIKQTQIADIIFNIRKETNPCSLCARMRRGALHDMANELGCNKLALGHNNDDVIETFFMNLFNEGRIGCFSPNSYLSRKDITVIRPLVYAPEKDIISAVNRCKLPIIESSCPANKKTNREDMKNYIADMQYKDKRFKVKIFGALKRSGIDGW